MDDKRATVLVADVSGHGVPAALIASMVKVAFSAQMARAASPGSVLSEVNRILCGKIRGQFVTAGSVYFDLERRLMRYSTAGHPPLLLWRSAHRTVKEYRLEGMLMGFLPQTTFTEQDIPLEPGDKVILYKDGIVEATDRFGEFFGKKRLVDSIESRGELPAGKFADALLEDLSQWSGRTVEEADFEDDLTLPVMNVVSE